MGFSQTPEKRVTDSELRIRLVAHHLVEEVGVTYAEAADLIARHGVDTHVLRREAVSVLRRRYR